MNNSFLKGEEFEEWCLDNLFLLDKKKGFSLINKSHYSKHMIESNKNPDFELYCNTYKIKFWVECKYLSSTDNFYNRKTIKMRNFQNNNHDTISLKEPVFYLFGIGGEPKKPSYLYLPPFKVINKSTKVENIRAFQLPFYKYKNFNELFCCQSIDDNELDY